MRVFLIGLGRAGCRIASLFFNQKKLNLEGLLVDTDKADLGFIRQRNRLIVGEGIVSGEGTQMDLGLGFELIQADRYHIVDMVTDLKDEVDCFFLVSALGGGTGGACGFLLEELKKNFIEPVYYIGVLPSSEDIPQAVINASKGIKEAIKHCDAFFPVDMDRLKSTTRVKGNYASINREIFRYFYPLFQIGEYKARSDIGENTVDFSDFTQIIGGLTVLGLSGKNFLEEPGSNKPDVVIDITKKATKNTTLEVELRDVPKALVVVRGDRKHMNFLGSIPARLWVEKNIGGPKVLGGDMPLERKGEVELLVALSRLKKSEGIARLYKKGESLKKDESRAGDLSEVSEGMDSIKIRLKELEKEIDETNKKLKELSKT